MNIYQAILSHANLVYLVEHGLYLELKVSKRRRKPCRHTTSGVALVPRREP
jgi:hypothetical protein